MYLKKTIVLVALAAATLAPSAMAMRAPVEGGNGDPTVTIQQTTGHPKKAHPNPKQPTLCVRFVQAPTTCLAFGL